MQESLEFATAVTDTVSFVLVTPDLFGKERVTNAGTQLRKASEYLTRWSRNLWTSAGAGLAMGLIMAVFTIASVLVTGLLALIWGQSFADLKAAWDKDGARTAYYFCLPIVIFAGVWTVLACCLMFASAIFSVLKRYNFNGVLLAIGALIFLTSRVLIMYDTWPH